jgi:drug/metabolite transporter (DMT)-like permease
VLGIVFTLISALWFAFAAIAMRRGVVTASALNGLYLTLLPGVPLFWLAALVTGQIFDADELTGREYGLLAAAGVVHFLVGRYCTLRALAILGLNRASPVIVTSVLVSVLLAVALLDEQLTTLMIVGITLVLVGPGLAASRPSRKPGAVPAGAAAEALEGDAPPTPSAGFDDIGGSRLIEGYAWAGLNAIAFGLSPVFIREALGDSGLGVLGGAVSYTAAGVLLLIPLALPGQVKSLRQVSGSARRWLIFGALAIMAAQMFRFLGLSNAPVSVTVPLLRGGIVFTIILSFIFNRGLESFDRRVLAGVAVSLVGSIALVL